jgi:hypothetical protein
LQAPQRAVRLRPLAGDPELIAESPIRTFTGVRRSLV